MYPAPDPSRVSGSHRGLGLGLESSQQTGSSKGDFSLLILCLGGGIQTSFPHRKPGKLGGGQEGVPWAGQEAWLPVDQACGVGVGQPRAQRGSSLLSIQGSAVMEVLVPHPRTVLWFVTLRPRPRVYTSS